jgi:branched-chain amino acid transport system permease protein
MGFARRTGSGESMIAYLAQIFTLFGINVILAISLNIINGYCGLFSLGHAGFFAVGAYASAYYTTILHPALAVSHPYLALLIACGVGMVSAAIAGLIVGIPCLRLTGDYLCMATIGFAEIIRIGLLNFEAVGASRGMPGIPKLTSVPEVVVAAIVSLWLLNNFMRSSFGRCIVSVREDEIAARSMGVNVRFYKTFAFVIGSAFAGLAGVLFAHNQQFLHPSNFVFMTSVMVLLMIVVGGSGSQKGAILGAFIVTLLPEALRFNPVLSQIRVLIFGLMLIAIMLIEPDGIMGMFRRGRNVFQRRFSPRGVELK